jgi:hypothetical protein
MRFRYFAKLRHPEVTRRLEKGERAIELKVLDAQQADVDQKQAEATARLIEALRDTPEAVIQAGSVLLVKTSTPVGQSIVCRTLTAEEMIRIKREPGLFEKPVQLLEMIDSGEARVGLDIDKPHEIDEGTGDSAVTG